jgi:hypothetical protein
VQQDLINSESSREIFDYLKCEIRCDNNLNEETEKQLSKMGSYLLLNDLMVWAAAQATAQA